MAKVLISEQIIDPSVGELHDTFGVQAEPKLWQDPARLAETVAETEALIVRNQTQVSAELIRSAPRLRIIGRAGVGLDNVDVPAASEAGVVVVNTPHQNAISVAELALGLMLGLARHLAAADRNVKEGGWDRQRFTGSELYGKTLGVVGFGRTGFLTAMRGKALGMRLLAHDPFVNPDAVTIAEAGARLVGIDHLLTEADVVVCHLPSTEGTRGFFTAERFDRMKPTALFINVARGDVADEIALARALEAGELAGAALDVRATEPPDPESPLHRMDNVLLTPHVGAFTEEAQARVVSAVCSDVASVLGGGAAVNYVNFPRPVGERAAG